MSTPIPTYQQLLAAIKTGALCHGDRFLETDLTRRFGVSRTPIREAIRRLETDGVVSHKPRVGAMIRVLSQQEIVELYEMRIVLEATAAQMAAKYTSKAEINTLETMNAQMMQAASDPNKVVTLNRKFHTCILSAAHNRFLAQSHSSLSNSLVLLGKTTLESAERVKDVVAQYDAIIAALKSGQAEIAAKMMRTHMQASLEGVAT